MLKRLMLTGVACLGLAAAAAGQARAQCEPGNGGLSLPPGFCATVAADNLGRARHMAVSPAGDLYVVLRAPDDGPNGPAPGVMTRPPTEAIVALRDADHDGRFEQQERFGVGLNGTGLVWHQGYLYVGTNTSVVRFKMTEGALLPTGEAETILSGLPLSLPHSTKPLAFDEAGAMYVQVGSPSNACAREERKPETPGEQPCRQLDLHGGIWKYDANTLNQVHRADNRFATGLRHTVGITWNPAVRALFAVQNGRDQLDTMWPRLFSAQDGADRVAEEFQRIGPGSNHGWPYCYYDLTLRRRVVAPEYGGDGRREGDCDRYDRPVAVFPSHTAPLDVMFYAGRQFPSDYRNGAFVSFHGSLTRMPFAETGFDVRFVPFSGDAPMNDGRVFATGFAGPDASTSRAARYRPVGLAQGTDGALYVSDDVKGRIWRISYTGQ